jgi:hypothetical protein
MMAHAARVKGRLGRADEARAIIRDLTERAQRGYVRAYLLAVANSGLGETEPTLSALERAVAERDLAIATLRHVTTFDALRNEPRFQQIEKSVEGKLWSSRLTR